MKQTYCTQQQTKKSASPARNVHVSYPVSLLLFCVY
jgi:hypothetical protein